LKSCCNNGAIKSHYLLAVKMLGTTQKGLTLVAELVPKGGMRSLSLSRVPSAVGAFLAEFSSRRLVASLAFLICFGSIALPVAAQVDPLDSPATAKDGNGFVDVVRAGNKVTVTFKTPYSDLPWGKFVNLSAFSQSQGPGFVDLFTGSLVSIRANVALLSYGYEAGLTPPETDSDFWTWATDLTVYVGPATVAGDPSSSGGVLQLGGTNGLDSGLIPLYWDYSVPGALPTDYSNYAQSFDLTVTLPSAITLGASQPNLVWLGNAYSDGNSYGRWSGSLEFTFASSGGSGVPDASRTGLLLAPGALLLLGLAGRSRRRG
jgi:hypothetical protein